MDPTKLLYSGSCDDANKQFFILIPVTCCVEYFYKGRIGHLTHRTANIIVTVWLKMSPAWILSVCLKRIFTTRSSGWDETSDRRHKGTESLLGMVRLSADRRCGPHSRRNLLEHREPPAESPRPVMSYGAGVPLIYERSQWNIAGPL